MITLVVSHGGQTTTHSFDRSPIIIGSKRSSADLPIASEHLQESHLEISLQEPNNKNQFIILNLANDPFTTLNGLPFWKRAAHHGDLIQVGQVTIRIEIPSQAGQIRSSSPSPAEEKVLKVLENSTHSFKEAALSIASKRESSRDAFTSAEMREMGKDPSKPFHSSSEGSAPTPMPKLSLKDYYLSEYDDKESKQNPNESSKSLFGPEIFKRWRLFFKIAAAFLGIVAIVVALGYLWVSDQSEEEEVNASRGIADVAMALTYAQVKHIHPKNQNWSDPEFIKKNLMAVLAPEIPSWADFEKQGQFVNCPYMLRIYTSSDLSQFLVIAQPVPSLLHWIVPKATIMIDSRAMEMRKVHDLKALNRLLINTAIDGDNAGEISALIEQGEFIPLSYLSDKKDTQAFSPPKALALFLPGAQNHVYNAPRYYSFSQGLLKRSIELAEKAAGSHEVSLLQQELAQLNKLPNYIFYSSDGIQHAMQSQKVLAMLAPKEKFHIAYLQTTSKGKITGAQLLMDDISSEIAFAEKPSPSLEEAYFSEIQKSENANSSPESSILNRSTVNSFGIDKENPLFLRLASINVARQQFLKSYNEELIGFLNKHTQAPQHNFLERLSEWQDKYIQADDEYQKKVIQEIDGIAHENANMPATRFLDFIRAAELEVALKDYLHTIKQQSLVSLLSKSQFEEQIKQIDLSSSLEELEQKAVMISVKLNFDSIPDEEMLIAYQDTVRSKVIQKLNEFLLSSDHALSQDTLGPECRQMLTDILEAAWILDSDTYDFYLSEFELRATPTDQTES